MKYGIAYLICVGFMTSMMLCVFLAMYVNDTFFLGYFVIFFIFIFVFPKVMKWAAAKVDK